MRRHGTSWHSAACFVCIIWREKRRGLPRCAAVLLSSKENANGTQRSPAVADTPTVQCSRGRRRRRSVSDPSALAVYSKYRTSRRTAAMSARSRPDSEPVREPSSTRRGASFVARRRTWTKRAARLGSYSAPRKSAYDNAMCYILDERCKVFENEYRRIIVLWNQACTTVAVLVVRLTRSSDSENLPPRIAVADS